MDNLATQNGVKAEGVVATDVQNQRSHAEAGVSNDKNTVISTGESAGKEYKNLQSEHEQGNKNFNDAKTAENERQKFVNNDAFSDYGDKVDGIKKELSKSIKDLK